MKLIIFTTFLLLASLFQAHSQQDNYRLDKDLSHIKQDLFNENIAPSLFHPDKKTTREIIDYGNPPEWFESEDFGGSSYDQGRQVAYDSQGNIIVTGSFSSKITFENTTLNSTGFNDAFVAKFSPAGNLLWFKQIPASTDHEINSKSLFIRDGKIYIAGYYTGSVILDNIQLPDKNEYNLFFAVLNEDGNITFARNYENSNDTVGLTAQKILVNDNNLYILAEKPEYGISNYKNASKLLKFTQNGELTTLFSTDENISDFVINDSAIYFTGCINGDGVIGGTYFNPTNGADIYIAKSSNSFNIDWAWMVDHTYGGFSFYSKIYIDPTKNIFLSGCYYNNIKFGDKVITGSGIFLTKFTDTTNFYFAKKIPDSYYRKGPEFIDGNNTSILLSFKERNRRKGHVVKVGADTGAILLKKTLNKQINFGIYDNENNQFYYTGNNNGLIFLSKADNEFNDIWDFSINGDSGDGRVISTETDQDNNVYIYGYTGTDIDYNGHTLKKGTFLCKQAPDGEIIWSQNLTESSIWYTLGNASFLDSLNKTIYIIGNFKDTLTLPNGQVLTAGEKGSLFVMKFKTNGTFQKAIKLNIPESITTCISIDKEENIILSGTFSDTITIGSTQLISYGSQNVFIVKITMDNNVYWALQAGGSIIELSGYSTIDGDNNIYLAGEFFSTNVQIGNMSITLEEGDGNIVLAKISPEGVVQWIKSTGGGLDSNQDYYSFPTGIAISNDNAFYLKGWHGKKSIIGNIILTSPYHFNKFIAKFDLTGESLWAKSITEHNYVLGYNKMAVDNNDNVYFGMLARDTINFGNDFEYAPIGNGDLFIAKYLPNGELDWVKTMPGEGRNLINSVSIFDSTLTVGGILSYKLTFGEQTLMSHIFHGFVSQCGKNHTGLFEVYNKSNHIKIYPNPLTDQSTLEFDNHEKTQYSLTILNIKGQKVRQINNITTNKITLKKSNLSKGLYILELNGKRKYTGNLLVN
jgi:hypothetical protein